MTIMNSIFSDKADQPVDKALAYNAMAAAATSAQAYFTAAITATTPELRAMLSGIANNQLTEHGTIANFMINKGWMDPYAQPAQQLETSKQSAESVLG